MNYFLLAICLCFLLQKPALARVSPDELGEVFKTFHGIFDERLSASEVLLFNDTNNGAINWLDYDIYRAAYHRAESKHFIWVFGGLINSDFMTIDGVALIVCHELGHGFGGPPYKRSGSTSEGQSDYFATGECLDNFFEASPRHLSAQELEHPAAQLCKDLNCLRKLWAIDVQRESFLRHDGVETSYFTPDLSIAESTSEEDTFYPSHQCRLDTYIAGALGTIRPRCWFAD